MAKRIFDDNEVMTALCLWEAMLELRGDTQVTTDSPIEQLWETYGSFSMRQCAIDLTHDCEVAWTAAEALGYEDSFDFDFCPSFIAGALESGLFDAKLDAKHSPWSVVAA